MSGIRTASWWLVCVAALLLVACALDGCRGKESFKEDDYTYEKVEGDPMDARIYTLDNGLRVYMSVYNNAPRIKATVAVRAGSRTDPDTATGLAHCLEHMMFKGTDELSATDFASEKRELDRISELFNSYSQVSDSMQRKSIYHRIDSISHHAAKYAITREYNKVMAALGATKTNAYTGVDGTIYTNEIPSNKVGQWLAMEYERFKDPVFRLFHTELAAICEEKNMELDNDRERASNALSSGLWRNHPYGTHTILGSAEHLENPSLAAIVDYFNAYYVPGNMAICVSGDFCPDSLIRMIDDTFGRLEPGEAPEYIPPDEEPIKEPVIKEVWGPDRSMTFVGFRFPGARSREAKLLLVTDWILMNGTAGLIDINLNQTQKVISPFCSANIYGDYSSHVFMAMPREGQSLEEVKDLLLSQLELLKAGEFQDWLPEAAHNFIKMILMEFNSSNSGRVGGFIDAFIQDVSWEDKVAEINQDVQFTKEDVVEFAKKYYRDNYVVVYKRTGEDAAIEKIAKPELTPVELNPKIQSDFAEGILSMESPEIEPEFLDFDRDIERFTVKNDVPVLYRRNAENDLFKMFYILDMGRNNDPRLEVALRYLRYLGTDEYPKAQFKQELFKLSCFFRATAYDDKLHILVSGLGKNFESSIKLIEEILANAEPDSAALKDLVKDIIKERADRKLNKHKILHEAMENYAKYGKHSPYTNILSEKELRELKGEELTEIIKGIADYKHRIFYYGPHRKSELAELLNAYHNVPEKLREIPEGESFEQLPMEDNLIYVCDYGMRQVEIVFLSKSVGYNADNAPIRRLFNEYYDGNMGSVVFQNLRESRGLAYSVEGAYKTPDNSDEAHYIYAYIGTQADKLNEAMAAMNELLSDLPESDDCLKSSKESIINQIRTKRITKSDILIRYEDQRRLGIADRDIRKEIFDAVPSIGMEELRCFFNDYVKGKKYTILALGDTDKMDMEVLKKYGEVRELSLEELFGY